MITRLLTLVEGLMDIGTKAGRRKVAVFAPPFFLAELAACHAFLFTDRLLAPQFVDAVTTIALAFGGLFSAGNIVEHTPKVIEVLRRLAPPKEEKPQP